MQININLTFYVANIGNSQNANVPFGYNAKAGNQGQINMGVSQPMGQSNFKQ